MGHGTDLKDDEYFTWELNPFLFAENVQNESYFQSPAQNITRLRRKKDHVFVSFPFSYFYTPI